MITVEDDYEDGYVEGEDQLSSESESDKKSKSNFFLLISIDFILIFER